MSASDHADRFVILRDGPTVPAAPYLLLLDFERRGLQVRADGQAVIVGPAALLTDEDRAAIRRWKWHLLVMIDYCGRLADVAAHVFSDAKPRAERTDDRERDSHA